MNVHIKSSVVPLRTKGIVFTPQNTLLHNEEIEAYATTDSFSEFTKRIASLNGQFLVLCHSSDAFLAAVDYRSTIPLFYRVENNHLTIGNNGFDLILPGEDFIDFSSDNTLFFSQWGFTPADHTLHPSIKRLEAGCTLCYRGGNTVEICHYNSGLPINQEYAALSYQEAKESFRKALNTAFDRMAKVVEGHTVVLPLTAGRDSRLIAVALKKRGIGNVSTFTYGKNDQIGEVIKAKKVAQNLNFPHYFIDTVPNGYTEEGYTKDREVLAYLRYISGLSSGYYFAEYKIARETASGLFGKQPIVLPGHNGDILGGDKVHLHWHKGKNNAKYNARQLTLLDLGNRKLSKKEVARLTDLHKRLFATYPQELSARQQIELFRNREFQSKYIINSSRSWDYFGVPVWMPFLDKDLIILMHSINFQYRFGKKIYEEVSNEIYREAGVCFDDDFSLYQTVNKPYFKLRSLVYPFLAYQLSQKKRYFGQDDLGFEKIMGGTIEQEVKKNIPWQPTTTNGLSFAWLLWHIKNTNWK